MKILKLTNPNELIFTSPPKVFKKLHVYASPNLSTGQNDTYQETVFPLSDQKAKPDQVSHLCTRASSKVLYPTIYSAYFQSVSYFRPKYSFASIFFQIQNEHKTFRRATSTIAPICFAEETENMTLSLYSYTLLFSTTKPINIPIYFDSNNKKFFKLSFLPNIEFCF